MNSVIQGMDPSFSLSFDEDTLTWSLSFMSGSANVGDQYVSDYVVQIGYADGTALSLDITQDPDATTYADSLIGPFLAPNTSYGQTRQAPGGLEQVVSL